jgi:zinc transport system ATP-binding protein
MSGHVHGPDCGHDHAHDHGPRGAFVPPTDAILTGFGLGVVKSGRTLLSDIDIALRPGEIVTLVGPNGAGKTTLVRVLLGLEPPTSGRIARAGGVVIGYVPQKFDVDPALPMTVARFLSLGLCVKPDQIAATLREVGAERVSARQVAQLSGGELQRVVLARALLRNPQLLVLDEPVRGVDHVGEAELYALINQVRTARGLCVLLVSHDLHIVMAQSDRVICINQHVCCSGRPEAVAQHPEYARLFGADAARAFAVYTHSHDHGHDLTGKPVPSVSPVVAQPGVWSPRV